MKTNLRKTIGRLLQTHGLGVAIGLTTLRRRVALAVTCAVITLLAASATAAPLKIACVGDSITHGHTLPSIDTYPSRLQGLLGTNFVVRNYGVGGTGILKKGEFPYWNEPEYTQSRNWGPDVVIIMLGSSDTWASDWVYGTNFMSDYGAFIASYQMLPSQPRVILCTPPPIYGNLFPPEVPGGVATNIAPAVRSLAAQFNLALIDYHIQFAGHQEWFLDGGHPNARGTAVMAALSHDAIRGIAAPPPTFLNVARGANNRAIITWPADAAGLVLQTTSQIASTNGWTVADSIPYSDGTLIRSTNIVGTTRFFRLWQPPR